MNAMDVCASVIGGEARAVCERWRMAGRWLFFVVNRKCGI